MSTDTDADAETDPNSERAREELIELASEFYDQFAEGDVPRMRIPTRTKSNIEYSEEKGVWVLGDRRTTRTAKTKAGAQKLLKAIYTIEFLAQQLEEGRSSTLRELYYLSESWDNEFAQFNDQDDSNGLIEDLEVVSGVTREDFHMRPEESGATLMGPLLLREQTRRGEREIHCQEDVGEGGYQIPNNPDTIEFLENDAEFILCVETGGMRDRLVENGFDEEHGCIVVHLKGQPARATRRITKRLHGELDIPVVVFTDSDPWSYRIYGSVAYGSIKSAHLSEYLATPAAQFVGIRPRDIVEYDLPTDPLSDSDINALESELDDPRFQTEFWREEIELQLDIGQKAEQQALASRGLDFVTDTYLPERLGEMGVF
ncbi:DNA topoisomerase VI [Haloglomus irregulare]|jgi:DNA topoisomerase-6 subunit A|uniref:Type 2 DNA topoisomerase 6 subunit A n=1 Tax=Haloglomus irregulare TaxID=2234134 RepID=A0A554N7M5_9EURY|nr:DNA topoisomerase IV subunit A [Haloglomus irregulare]TSD13401.1 DNA topoisomerase VI [Haloglomus irregulare]